jgi:hypothetical protein
MRRIAIRGLSPLQNFSTLSPTAVFSGQKVFEQEMF